MVRLDYQKVLNCEGRGFHADWKLLHQSLQSGNRRDSVQLAATLVGRWRNRSKSCELFPEILLGKVSVRQLNGFCPFGFAAALRAASWNVRPLGRGGSRKKRERQLLDEALQCLGMGGRWWTWNFHSDSKWRTLLNPLDLVTGKSWRKATSGPEPLASRDTYMEGYQRQLQAAIAPWRSAKVTLQPKLKAIVISAFGVHTTTLLEPIFAFREVVPQDIVIAMALFGATHPEAETLLPEVCPDDVMLQRPSLRCFTSIYPKADWWSDLLTRPLQPALDELGEILAEDAYVQRSEMLVCGGGGSPMLCLMLRMVTDLPLLITLQAPLTFRMPSAHQPLFVGLFREIAKPSVAKVGPTVISTSLIFLQRQVWVQTGRLLPVVRNHNWYAIHAAARRGEASVDANEVLFWQNHVSLKWDVSICLFMFLKQLVPDSGTFPFRLVFKNFKRLPSRREGRKVYGLSARDSMTQYADLSARFAAAVIFPHDIGIISFDDLYAIGTPLFLPQQEVVENMAYAHLVSTSNYPWYLLRQEHSKLNYPVVSSGSAMPWDAGWNWQSCNFSAFSGEDTMNPELLRHAIGTANYLRLPHIHYFNSLSDLLHLLESLGGQGLQEIRQAMKKSSADAWLITSEFYRSALGQLLGSESSE